MRRLVLGLLLGSVCLLVGAGCGKEPPIVKTEPIRKGRIPAPNPPPKNP